MGTTRVSLQPEAHMLGLGWVLSLAAAGPFEVTLVDVTFEDSHFDRGTITGRVYTPDLAGGPYPLVAFLHGWMGSPSAYDDLCTAVASEGFAVASIGTQSGLVVNTRTFADDTRALLAFVEDESADPLSDWFGLADGSDWTALGHSLGGATLGVLVGVEPRVTTVVGYMPYLGGAEGYDGIAAFSGSLLYFAGTDDTTSPPFVVADWFERTEVAERALYAEVGGGGHQGPVDIGPHSDGSLDPQVQLDLYIEMTLGFLRAEVLRDEEAWEGLAGMAAPTELVEQRSRSRTPALWGTLDGDVLELGVATWPEATVTFWAGSSPTLADAVVVGSAAPSSGLSSAPFDTTTWGGADLYLQAVADVDGIEGTTRTLEVFTGREPPTGTATPTVPTEETGAPNGSASVDSQVRPDEGGCATSPGPRAAWALLSPLLARRATARRQR